MAQQDIGWLEKHSAPRYVRSSVLDQLASKFLAVRLEELLRLTMTFIWEPNSEVLLSFVDALEVDVLLMFVDVLEVYKSFTKERLFHD